jgi:hypothetical protein
MPHSLSRVLLIVLGAAALMACSRPVDPKAYADAYDPGRHPYVIGVGDMLSVHVWKDPELSTETVVRPDGTITVPLIGEVAAQGKTASAVRDQISQRVGKYVKDAIVTVAVPLHGDGGSCASGGFRARPLRFRGRSRHPSGRPHSLREGGQSCRHSPRCC